jgi:signal peptidase II
MLFPDMLNSNSNMKKWLQRNTMASSDLYTSKAARGLLLIVIALAVIGLDQLTKYLVRAHMELGESIPREGIFRLTYTTNTGGAFGILANQAFLLALVAIIGIAVFLVYLRYIPLENTLLKAGLGLDMGGAIGNLIDRLRLEGRVTDFIDIGAWPVFNVADMSIVVGTIIIAYYLLFVSQKKAPDKPQT